LSSFDEKPCVLTTCQDIHQAVAGARSSGKTVGLVPTMGALHAGHLSLVDASIAQCDVTVVTIFINPTQFGPGEDLAEYPRTLEADLASLAERGVHLVFAPANEEILPPGYSTYVEPPEVARPLEGRCRPGHFRGVTTVVLKLFHLIPAHVAYFGHKDYQQSVVIRRMVEDFDLPVRIEVCPTVREPDNLAMSSRNAYLTPPERQQALALYRSLSTAAELVGQGERHAATIRAKMQEVLVDAGITRIDYVALVKPESLKETDQITRPTVALVAAFVGQTRLIDNLRIGQS